MRRCAFVAVVVVLLLSACGVPTGKDTFSEIPSEEIPLGLDATSTTSTSTTTTTVVDVPETTLLETTTTIRLEPVQIYFLSRGRLQPVPFDLPPGSAPDQIADVLEAGPPPGIALDTLIEDGLIVGAVTASGILTVDLDPATFARVPTTQQTEAIGQIVLTMLSSLRGVGQVTFTLGGQPIAVKKGNGLSSDVGQPVSYDDYRNLLVAPSVAPAETTPPNGTSAP